MNIDQKPIPATLCQMVKVGASNHGFSVEDVTGPCRKRDLAVVRWKIAMAARLAGYSLTQIGWALNRDHSSILSGLRKLKKLEAVL